MRRYQVERRRNYKRTWRMRVPFWAGYRLALQWLPLAVGLGAFLGIVLGAHIASSR